MRHGPTDTIGFTIADLHADTTVGIKEMLKYFDEDSYWEQRTRDIQRIIKMLFQFICKNYLWSLKHIGT